jgi:hypothetical protein
MHIIIISAFFRQVDWFLLISVVLPRTRLFFTSALYQSCAMRAAQWPSPRVRDMAGCVAAAELAVFSEDGSRLAVSSLDGELKVWSGATRTLVSRFTPEDARGGVIAAASWSRVSQ